MAAEGMEGDVANLQANGVPGIFPVADKLRVESKKSKA
jgi:hypothetical protein